MTENVRVGFPEPEPRPRPVGRPRKVQPEPPPELAPVPEPKPKQVGRPCKICSHPARGEIEAMILNGTSATNIIRRARAAYPTEPELTEKNISVHRTRHLLTKPISVDEIDPETGEVKKGYLIGHLSHTIQVRREDLPKDSPSLPEALRTIITAGIRNILIDPGSVTPAILVMALDMARKLNLGSGDEDDFKEAWGELGKKKNAIKEKASRAKRTRRVTFEETEETVDDEDTLNEPEDTFIDATPAPLELPDPEWSIDSLTRSTTNDEEPAALRRSNPSQ